jgi:hypothetical protein
MATKLNFFNNFRLLHSWLSLNTYQGQRSFPFAEVEAFDVESRRDGVDKEEADNPSVDVDKVIHIDPEKPCQEANPHHNCKVDNLQREDVPVVRLLGLEYAEEPFSKSRTEYLLIIMNSGNTE